MNHLPLKWQIKDEKKPIDFCVCFALNRKWNSMAAQRKKKKWIEMDARGLFFLFLFCLKWKDTVKWSDDYLMIVNAISDEQKRAKNRKWTRQKSLKFLTFACFFFVFFHSFFFFMRVKTKSFLAWGEALLMTFLLIAIFTFVATKQRKKQKSEQIKCRTWKRSPKAHFQRHIFGVLCLLSLCKNHNCVKHSICCRTWYEVNSLRRFRSTNEK